MKYLIVSADDFGLSKSINEGIVKSYREGIVNNLNFIPTGYAFPDAAEFAKASKLEEAGGHLALTGTSPVTDPKKIPTLVTHDGKFRKSYAQFFASFFLGRIDRDQIYTELKNQLDAVKKIGISITNLSSHEHLHMMPAMLDIFVALAKEYNIPSIRCLSAEKMVRPISLKKIYKRTMLPVLAGKMKARLGASKIYFTDNFSGFLDSGAVQEGVLLEMLRSLKDGVTELVCHPGFVSPEVLDRCIFHAKCETELFAVTSRKVKELIEEDGAKLIKFGELPAIKARVI